MQARKLYDALCLFQGTYTLVTALWAIVDIHSFMEITGPKTDIWLVKTVALLLVPVGICLLLGHRNYTQSFMVTILALTSSTGLSFVDFYYSSNGTISRIYQADGILQIFFIGLWLWIHFNLKY